MTLKYTSENTHNKGHPPTTVKLNGVPNLSIRSCDPDKGLAEIYIYDENGNAVVYKNEEGKYEFMFAIFEGRVEIEWGSDGPPPEVD